MPYRSLAVLFAAMPLIAWAFLETDLALNRDRYGPRRRPLLVVDRNLEASLLTSRGEVRSGAPVRPVALETIPSFLPRALLLQEDQAFYEHRGYHLREMYYAVYDFLFEGRRLRGASTITQQLARTLFLSREKTARRKLLEVRVARILERRLSKDRILELYLNHVYWGRNQYGLGAAVDMYYGKPPLLLTKEEAAYLVSLLPNPDICGKHLICSTPRLSRRQERILRYLARTDEP